MKFTRAMPILFVFLLIILFGTGYLYFFEVSPINVEKPEVEKPTDIDLSEKITEQHIIYILNELEAYKLHNAPLDEEKPAIQVIIEDTDQVFLMSVEDNNIKPAQELEPDITIHGNKEVVLGLFEKPNLHDAVIYSFNEGQLWVETDKSQTLLALKGYMIIYDKLASGNKVTGEVVAYKEMNITQGMKMLSLLIVSFIIGMVVEKS